MNNMFFPSHFLCIICGWPGSGIIFLIKPALQVKGKTSLLKFMLKSDKLLFKKYNEILVLSPSVKEYDELLLPSTNMRSDLDFEFINKKIESYNKRNADIYFNLLIIIDDLIAKLNKNQREKDLLNLIFNRRHLIENGIYILTLIVKIGMISIIITTQKYNLLPTSIRSNANMLITFLLNDLDWELICNQLIREDWKKFKEIIKEIFTENTNFMIYRVDKNVFFKNFNKI